MSSPPCCFKRDAPVHRMVDCRKGHCYGKELFIESEKSTNDALVDIEQGHEFDTKANVEEEGMLKAP